MRSRFPSVCLFAVALLLLGSVSPAAQSASLTFLNDILDGAQSASTKSSERLSSGRILLADDPANSAVYAELEGQVRAIRAEIGNEADMLSYYRFMDAILGNLTDIAQRIRELLVQRSNGLLDSAALDAIDGEIGELYDEMGQTLRDAEFNRVKVFADLVDPPRQAFFRDSKHYDLGAVGDMLDLLIGDRSAIGAKVEALGFTMSGRESESLNAESALSQGDTDFAKEIVELERSQLLVLADLLMLRRVTSP